MVGDSVEFLHGDGLRVFFDAEHFFDGYKRNPEFALRVLEAAAAKGAELPRAVRHQRRLAAARGAARSSARSSAYFGDDAADRHPHPDDTGCAVANAVAAVRRRRHASVQGTINGYGERTGNANLMTSSRTSS